MYDQECVETAYARLWTRGIEVEYIEIRPEGVVIVLENQAVEAATLEAAVSLIIESRVKL
jgi:hypothetical protein